jgi:hypothetical protein
MGRELTVDRQKVQTNGLRRIHQTPQHGVHYLGSEGTSLIISLAIVNTS